jgi:hypothetical protein
MVRSRREDDILLSLFEQWCVFLLTWPVSRNGAGSTSVGRPCVEDTWFPISATDAKLS